MQPHTLLYYIYVNKTKQNQPINPVKLNYDQQ